MFVCAHREKVRSYDHSLSESGGPHTSTNTRQKAQQRPFASITRAGSTNEPFGKVLLALFCSDCMQEVSAQRTPFSRGDLTQHATAKGQRDPIPGAFSVESLFPEAAGEFRGQTERVTFQALSGDKSILLKRFISSWRGDEGKRRTCSIRRPGESYECVSESTHCAGEWDCDVKRVRKNLNSLRGHRGARRHNQTSSKRGSRQKEFSSVRGVDLSP